MRGSAAALISDSGLYTLILRSDTPEARTSQDWVTRNVLPAIRKDGSYVMGVGKVATGEMDEDTLIFRAMEAMQRKVARLTEEKEKLAAANANEDLLVTRPNQLGNIRRVSSREDVWDRTARSVCCAVSSFVFHIATGSFAGW